MDARIPTWNHVGHRCHATPTPAVDTTRRTALDMQQSVHADEPSSRLTLCNSSQESRAPSLRVQMAVLRRHWTLQGVCPHCTLPLPRPGRKPRPPTTAQGSGVRGSRGGEGQDGKGSKEDSPTPDKHMARLRVKNNATGCGASQPDRWRTTWQSCRISLSSVSHQQ